MTATDELRRMLDECGVEHWDTVGITEYRGENDRTVRCYARPEPMTLDVSIIAAPPEQAIEATLGGDLKAENESLRELVRIMHSELVSCEDNGYVCGGHKFDKRVSELGVEP